MHPEPHQLQQDPPEGDRDLIDRELARQGKRLSNETARDQLSGAEKTPGEPPSSDERAARDLKNDAEIDTGKGAVDASASPSDGRSDTARAMDDVAPQTGVRPGP